MKIIVLIFLSTCALSVNSEYPRFKRRGPPQPPRSSPMGSHMKKWPPPPQFPQSHRMPPSPQQVRARPIPVHMPLSHKIPMGIAPVQSRPVAQPVRSFWKNSQVNNVKFSQQEKQQYAMKYKEKPFLSSPAMSAQEYDYHLQANTIPTHTNPIKQVGEKGPIHTIPAPNLSPADRPASVLHETRHQDAAFQKSQYLENPHQYHVTEPNEPLPKPKMYRPNHQQILLQQQIKDQHQKAFLAQEESKYQQQQQQEHHHHHLQEQQHQQYFPSQDQQFLTQNLLMSNPQSHQQQSLFNFDTVALPQQPNDYNNNNQMIQVASGVPAAQQHQLLHTQAIQSNFYQQQNPSEAINFQTFMNQPSQLYQPDRHESELLDSLHMTSEKSISVQPEYHNFNYDEQAYQKSNAKGDISGLVSAAYNLDGSSDISEQIVSGINSRSSMDPLEQAQIVQNYFDTRSEVVTENAAAPDVKPSAAERKNDNILLANLYSSLPNKEAADRLAQLQAAGKVNSNLMKIPPAKVMESKNPMTIYVPDDDSEKMDESNRDQSLEYDDEYEQEDDNVNRVKQDEKNQVFGHKISS